MVKIRNERRGHSIGCKGRAHGNFYIIYTGARSAAQLRGQERIWIT
jgi:hypothetical protein